jgi:hypothetical protein
VVVCALGDGCAVGARGRVVRELSVAASSAASAPASATVAHATTRRPRALKERLRAIRLMLAGFREEALKIA